MDAYRESQNFAYAVAHDLKSPLRAISGFCALLEQSAADRLTEQERAYIDRATQGALRMASLIDALLQYSRIEHREQRISTVDCRQFVEALIADMSYAIERVGAEVIVNMERTPVMADQEGLRIALSNLFDEPNIDALTVMKWKEMFDRIETAVDKCEHIAAIIGTIQVKYA